jgi:hypothetical protein
MTGRRRRGVWRPERTTEYLRQLGGHIFDLPANYLDRLDHIVKTTLPAQYQAGKQTGKRQP